MHPFSLIALPGFLGRKEDWQHFSLHVQSFKPMDLLQAPSLKSFAKIFNEEIASSVSAPRILMGYSLGARLAMHALLDNPSIWSKAIFISGHTGLSLKEEREARKKYDALLAEEFVNGPWEIVTAKWEAQEVFKAATHRFTRQEQDYDRLHLAHCLTNYSLGMQENLRAEIAELDLPILWVTGQKDEKFSKIADRVVLKNSQSQKIALAGSHRVPWEAQEEFQKAVNNFLNL